ncbi:MAG: TolC family protein [Sediminibacterium sp.]|jgi:outer membrane protein TolC
MLILNKRLNTSIIRFLKNRLFKLVVLLLFFFSAYNLSAQESMMQDISNPFLAKLIDTATKYYPQVKVLQRRMNIAEINLRKTKLSWYDVLSVSAYYSPTNSSNINMPTLTGFQVGFNVNIAALIQKPFLIKVAKEDVEISKLGQQEYTILLASDVKTRYIKYVQSATILRIQTGIAIEAESVLKDIRYKFEKGETIFENYSKALVFMSDNKKSVIDAESNFLVAKTSLETIIGKKLSEIQ